MKKSRRLKLKSLTVPQVPDLVQTVLNVMARGVKVQHPVFHRMRSWFLTRSKERNYPSTPFSGEREKARRRQTLSQEVPLAA